MKFRKVPCVARHAPFPMDVPCVVLDELDRPEASSLSGGLSLQRHSDVAASSGVRIYDAISPQ